MQQSLSALVLAAGKGTRMNSRKLKVLHEIAGLPLVCHVIEAIKPLQPDNIVVVLFARAQGIRWIATCKVRIGIGCDS